MGSRRRVSSFSLDEDPSFEQAHFATSTPVKPSASSSSSYQYHHPNSYSEDDQEQEESLRVSDTESVPSYSEGGGEVDANGSPVRRDRTRLTRWSLAKISSKSARGGGEGEDQGMILKEKNKLSAAVLLVEPTPSTSSSTLVEKDEQLGAEEEEDGGGYYYSKVAVGSTNGGEKGKEKEDMTIRPPAGGAGANRKNASAEVEEDASSSSPQRVSSSKRRKQQKTLSNFLSDHSPPPSTPVPATSTTHSLPPKTPHAPGAFPPYNSTIPPSGSSKIRSAFATYITGPNGALSLSAERERKRNSPSSNSTTAPTSVLHGSTNQVPPRTPHPSGWYPPTPSSTTRDRSPILGKSKRAERSGRGRGRNGEDASDEDEDEEEQGQGFEDDDMELELDQGSPTKGRRDGRGLEETLRRFRQHNHHELAPPPPPPPPISPPATRKDSRPSLSSFTENSSPRHPPATSSTHSRLKMDNSRVRFAMEQSYSGDSSSSSELDEIPPPRLSPITSTSSSTQKRPPPPASPPRSPSPPSLPSLSPESSPSKHLSPVNSRRSTPKERNYWSANSRRVEERSIQGYGQEEIQVMSIPKVEVANPFLGSRSTPPPPLPPPTQPSPSRTPPLTSSPRKSNSTPEPNPSSLPPRTLSSTLSTSVSVQHPSEVLTSSSPDPLDPIQALASELLKVVRSSSTSSLNSLGLPSTSTSLSGNPERERRRKESEIRKKELEDEMNGLIRSGGREAEKRSKMEDELRRVGEEEGMLERRVLELRVAVEAMTEEVGAQVSAVVERSFATESRKRTHWLVWGLLFQLFLLWFLIRYANQRAFTAYQTIYHDPFYPALFLPASSESAILPETLRLFDPHIGGAGRGSGGVGVEVVKGWIGSVVRDVSGWGQ